MRRTIFVFLVTLAVTATSSGIGGFQTPKPAAGVPAPQKVGDKQEIRVVAVRTAREWKGMPAMGTVTAKPGWALLVVEFAVTDLASGQEDSSSSFSGVEVEDAAGERHKSPFMGSNLRELPFSVPDPAGVRFFRIGGLSFDIQGMTKSLKKA